MAEIKIDDTIDITDVVCPTTFVKAKVALEELEEGQILRSIKEEGHEILKLDDNQDGTYTLIVKKVGD